MNILNNLSTVITVIGALAFIVTVITQVTKDIYPLNNIPTKLEVLILSVLLSILSYFIYISYKNIAFIWYMPIGAIILGFIVAYVSSYGWDSLKEIYNKLKK